MAQRLGQLRNNEQLITTKATGDYQPLAEALLSAEEVVKFPESSTRRSGAAPSTSTA